MCLAVPVKLVKAEEGRGVIEAEGVFRDVELCLVPEARVGDYVLVHAGYAISVLTEEMAKKSLEALSAALGPASDGP
ncbi:MAG: HypC/HybG/HupF family hydrogenase formation chaperone [Thermodesulfobacteriota bacterium]